ncbi:MAG TPA: DoxX family protein [Chitinophagaceae bacterium]|jgi:uncharacterized membrane protein YphA (DoxX/SURF4 family)|nr:DoxX family protein [Chitinophagaceae bacterium]
MNHWIGAGRTFYALALIGYGGQQFYFGTFRNVFFSPYQAYLPGQSVWAYLFGGYLISSGVLLLRGKRGRGAALWLGAVLLLLFLVTQLPYQFLSEPNKIYHLGLWVNQLKELALAGGAFVVAGSYPHPARGSRGTGVLERLQPYGNLFFLLTIFLFGLGHLMYGPLLAGVVPRWCPDPVLWVYLTGAALVGAGVALFLGIRIRVVALLLALMIFLWFWTVHVPEGLARPVADRGNSLASAFDALAFSGTALLIALTMRQQQWVVNVEREK